MDLNSTDPQHLPANHVDEHEDHRDSAETSPEGTIDGSTLHRTESLETLISSDATQVASSEAGFQHPPPPPNTPYTQSVVSDMSDHVTNELGTMPGGAAQATTAAGTVGVEGKAHLRARVRSDVPLLQQLFKRPPAAARRVRRMTKKALTGAAPTRSEAEDKDHIEHVHEGSTWVNLAMEDVARGLERLAMAAKDLNKIESSKSVEEYYNEMLAEVLKAAQIQFDLKYLE